MSTRVEAWVVPIERACEAIAMAAKAMAGAAPPNGTRLPRRDRQPARRQSSRPAATTSRTPSSRHSRPPNFDITLLTLDAGARGRTDPIRVWISATGRTTFATRRRCLLVRVSPQFEESMWKMLGARRRVDAGHEPAAAQELHGELPPACAPTAATPKCSPIHPFIIEHHGRRASSRFARASTCSSSAPSGRSARRSGFRCSRKRTRSMPTPRTIDPKLFEQLAEAVMRLNSAAKPTYNIELE